jgi:hypothetical protein
MGLKRREVAISLAKSSHWQIYFNVFPHKATSRAASIRRPDRPLASLETAQVSAATLSARGAAGSRRFHIAKEAFIPPSEISAALR